MNRKINILDIIAWIVLAGILLWLVLKVFGVLNTPNLIESAPYFGIVYLAGWAMHKLDIVSKSVIRMGSTLRDLEKDVLMIKTVCPECQKRK